MIPVVAQAEPPTFDLGVRQPGLAWLAAEGISLTTPLPKRKKIPSYWTSFSSDLYQSYSGICAYLGIHVERATGAMQVEHYVAKSTLPGKAYDWDNYRLASSRMNQRKWNFSTVLDPFHVIPDSFQINFVTGIVSPAPSLTAAQAKAVSDTINRLQLNDPDCKSMRVIRFDEYRKYSLTPAYMQKYFPFIWSEMVRQALN